MGKCTAIVLAAGKGRRMNTEVQKQFLEIKGHPVIYYSLKCFQESPLIDEIILVTGKESISYCQKEIIDKYSLSKVKKVTAGGKERYDSVYEGLLACTDTQYVMIHDGARPFVTQEILERGMEGVLKHKACVIGMPSKDTVKLAGEDGCILDTPDRRSVWTIQTPQIFEYSLIKKAYDIMRLADMSSVTDDAMVVERAVSHKVALVQGSYQNIKITTPEDLLIAEVFLKNSL